MTAKVRDADVSVGTSLPVQAFRVRRVDLVRYCGASGDFNTIHWNERVARSVGLPNVIAHGMFTMAAAGRVLTDWVGDPGAIEEYGVRFSLPVVVPDNEGAVVLVGGRVEDKLTDSRVIVGIEARVGEDQVLSAARAVVRLA